jgi:UDP-glucose 4-epimerase
LNNNKVNILVTGGAGFIGSIFCSHLKKKYNKFFNILVIDNLSSGNKKYLNCDKFYKIDLKDSYKLNNFFKKNRIDIVVHLAGYTNLRDPSEKKFYINNFLATKNLIDILIKFNIKKLIFASTAAVYGNPLKTPINETAATKPISHYGISKLKAENYIKKNSQGNYQSIIFRFFNASGASYTQKIGEDKDPAEHLIPIILRGFLNKEKVKIFNNFDTSDGTGVRDYVHVEDIVMALIKSIHHFKNMKESFTILNLGSGKGVSSLFIVKRLQILLKEKINFIFTIKRIGEPNILLSSIKKAKIEINWSPKKNINKILKESIFWEKYINNINNKKF